jgi:hypothetical protein
MKNHYKGYVKSEIEQAKELFFANKTYKHIAEHLGRTEAAIKDLFKRMGYKRYKAPTSANYSKAV